MVPPNNLGPDLAGKPVNETSYRGMIGLLMYLTATRPDIQFSTVLCARYQSNLKESHLTTVEKILRYLKGTPTLGLYYPKSSDFDLKGYSDSNYVGCNMDKKAPQVPVKYLVENWFVGVPRNINQWPYPQLKLNMSPLLGVVQVLGGNYSSTKQVNSIQQILAYCLTIGTEVDIEEIIYSDLILTTLRSQDEKFGFLPGILSNSNFTKDPSKVTNIKLTAYMITVNSQKDSVSPLPLAANLKKGKSQIVTPTLPKSQGPEDLTSMTSDEGTSKTTLHLEGLLGDKDSGGNIPPADMEPIHHTIADLSGTGAKYQVDQTQSTRLSEEDILGAGEEIDEEPQDASIAEVHHQSPPPQADKPQSSHALSTEVLDTDSSCDDILKKYENILPLTERQLVKYLRKMSNALFARINEDNCAKHEEAAVNYVDLKASIDNYYDENIAHSDQTDKLVEASMSSLDKSNNTISDLYKGLNIVTKLLKEIKHAVKDDSVINKKIIEATESFTKFSTNITDLQSSVNTLQAHALKQDEKLTAWAKSSTNMA
ncbi:hypothetical protein Tco_1300342 [Tanacetum coccineum]